ncbi:MAG: ubiquinone biosynthesis regulatory protein kinase UbiB [Vibrio sp.]
MTLSEFRRLYTIIKTQLEYGLEDLLPEHASTVVPKKLIRLVFWLKNKHTDKEAGTRLRLALQELGPVWIKLGQMMSTRRDLFPDYIADPLAMLQDKVSPFDGQQAKAQIEAELGGPIDTWFDDFDIEPLASASIAQVHTATHRESGQEVVLKIIRPDILPVIQADLKLMYRMAGLLARFMPDSRRLKPVEVIEEYEKTLINELDLRREAANALQLKRNFEGSEDLYVPDVLMDFTTKNLMVSERIYGIQVSEINVLKENGTNMKRLAEKGVTVFFTQVFRDSFFHADMHPGNVFVAHGDPDNPLWIGLDCGIVGTLNSEDKRYLAENFLAFFNRDYHKVAQLHIDSGWVPHDTDVREFEAAIRVVCEPIFAKPLCEISFGHVLLNLFSTAREFNMEVQPQLVLLQKTLLYVEGLGRQLYPQLDLWETAKPFLERWMLDQVGPKALFNSVKDKAPLWAEKLPELPDMLFETLKRGREMDQKLTDLYQAYSKTKRKHATGKFLFGIGATLIVCSAILQLSPDELRQQLSIAGGLAGLLCWLVGWKVYR